MERLVDLATRLLLRRPPAVHVVPVLSLAIVAVTAARDAIDGGRSGFLFAPYLPIVLLTAMLCGWRFALLALAGSMLAVHVTFLPGGWGGTPYEGVIPVLGSLTLSTVIMVGMAEFMRLVVRRAAEQAQDMETFNAELVHRNKNAMQLMIGMIQRGLSEPDMADYFTKLPPRMMAWGRAGELLRYGVLPACDLRDLIDMVLSPFPQERIDLTGAPVRIDRSVATALAMALHELATNACKYGALSTNKGRVLLAWTQDGALVRLVWTELDGPPVVPPVRQGFGTRLLSRQRAFAHVAIDYLPAGLRAELAFASAGSDAA